MQAHQQTLSGGAGTGFSPIPTRIREIPPLITTDEGGIGDVPAMHERLSELARGLARTHRAAAEAWLASSSYGEARAHLDAAVTFAPDVLEYHNQRGFVAYLQGDDEAAAQAFQQVLQQQPTHADALFNLGMVLFGRQDAAGAEECFRRVCEVRSDDAETWNNRGVCLHILGRGQEARICFQNALQIQADNEDARANLAAIGG